LKNKKDIQSTVKKYRGIDCFLSQEILVSGMRIQLFPGKPNSRRGFNVPDSYTGIPSSIVFCLPSIRKGIPTSITFTSLNLTHYSSQNRIKKITELFLCE
jgi:hypothetical protein